MNIKIQCCGLAILLIIALFFRRQKRLYVYTEKAFTIIFRITAVSILLDIVSLTALSYFDRLPLHFVNYLCKSYNISLVLVAMSGLFYVLADAYTGLLFKRIRQHIIYLTVAEAMAVYLTPITYITDSSGQITYTFGASVILTYLFGTCFVLLTFFVMLRNKDRINPLRRYAVILWFSAWLTAILIQLFFKDLFVIGFGSAVGVLILYIKLENPETYLDRTTGMFNNNALNAYLKDWYGKQQRFSMVCLVLEDFSNVGIDKEELLKIRLEIANYFQTITNALIFRKSEDEILLVFDYKDDADAALNTLRKRFTSGWGQTQLILHPGKIYITDSLLFHDGDELLHVLRYVRQNEKKLYGRYSVQVTEEIITRMRQEKQIEQLILKGVENDRIEVFYQPIYSTKERCFTCAEALVRIYDDDGKLIPPGLFIEVAEKNGMILRLGKIVFEKVCRLICEKKPEQYGLHYIEVNLSTVQCAYENLADEFIEIMEQYHLPPERINLEITESASLSAKQTLLRNMKVMMDYGIRFSLDDFGTGQANLNYIMEMPVDIVKFDKQMSQAYFEDQKSRYIMDTAISMVHGMELEIVSEGIEKEDQLRTMEDLGIRYIQGFYFSKPLPEHEFLNFLQANNC